MRESFKLAWRALVRGHVLSLLLAATALAYVLLPALVRSDGTAAGWREMFVRAVPGATYAVTAIVILSCACGFLAQERDQFRLSLTVVRPASAFSVVLGKWLALCAVAAAAYALTAGLTMLRVPEPPPCMHHIEPALPSPIVAARGSLDAYLADPKTPEFVKKAPRPAVLRLLTNKELDRYDVIRPGESLAWPFPAKLAERTNLFVRVRFATQFDLRSPLAGTFTLGGLSAVVSNNTQSIIDVPLVQGGTVAPCVTNSTELCFSNTGKEVVMVRPRRDLEVLAAADPFAANLARAAVQMFSVTALLAAFGLFLSSALSRPVSIFTALVAVAVILMAPSVVVQFPDEIETTLDNKIGLVITRTVYALTSAAGEAKPISDLATDACIEWLDLLRGVIVNVVLLPLGLLGATAWIMRRKPLANQS
ncbi:MAG: hypothetical protein ACI4RA_05075 [Kiritimatiellia bacterium]